MKPHQALAIEDEEEAIAEQTRDVLFQRAAQPLPVEARRRMLSAGVQGSTQAYLEAGESDTEETTP